MIKFESEQALEDFVLEQIENDGVNPLNGRNVHHIERQVDLGVYGIADLVSVEYVKFGFGVSYYINVIELKNEMIKPINVGQLMRYITGINEMEEDSYHEDFTVVGSLLTKRLDNKVNIDADTFYFVNANFEDITLYEFELDPHKGIKYIKSGGWRKTEGRLPKISDIVEATYSLKLDHAEQESEDEL